MDDAALVDTVVSDLRQRAMSPHLLATLPRRYLLDACRAHALLADADIEIALDAHITRLAASARRMPPLTVTELLECCRGLARHDAVTRTSSSALTPQRCAR